MVSRSCAGSSAFAATESVRPYLNQIGRIPLLNKEREVDLATKYRAGLEAAERLERVDSKGLSVTAAERRRLRRIVDIGESAKDALVEANLRLVVKNAKAYSGSGLSLADLIQAGNIGLMRAVEKFDYTRGFKFSTYATHWIRQGIRRTVADQARTIRLPVHLHEQIHTMRRISRELAVERGHEPEADEVAEVMGVSVERLAELKRVSKEVTSLEAPVGAEGDASLGDFIADTTARNAAEELEVAVMCEEVRRVLAGLPVRERRIVELRFGFDDGRPRTLEEVGRAFGVTRERIRQIECKTMAKLRESTRVAELREYLA